MSALNSFINSLTLGCFSRFQIASMALAAALARQHRPGQRLKFLLHFSVRERISRVALGIVELLS